MENPEGSAAGFNEDAALAELERLRQEIMRYRTQRKQLVKQFDDFVDSFKDPSRSPSPPPQRRPDAPREEVPPVASTSPEDETATAIPPPPAAAPAQRARFKSPAVLAGALTVLAAGGWVTWMVKARAPRPAAAVPIPEPSPTPSAAPAATEPARQPGEPVSELTTTNPVWVRIIADGEKVVERELPANARIPLTARQTLVIRAGNAGVVRVTLAGRDQGVLGPEGTVITRTFNLAARQGETRDR
jgi:Domain of unknown function (DUF4115)